MSVETPDQKPPEAQEQDVFEIPLPTFIIIGRGTYTPPPPKDEGGVK